MMNETLILVNPEARQGRLGQEWPMRQNKVLEALGNPPSQIVFTTLQEKGAGIIRDALLQGIQRFLVIGGDGTFSEAIQGFFQEGRPVNPDAVLMLLPAGRGDDFFKALTGKRFKRSEEAWDYGLEILRKGSPRKADIGKINWIYRDFLGKVQVQRKNEFDRYFINITSFGFAGLVVQAIQTPSGLLNSPFIRKTGFIYSASGFLSFMKYQPLTVKVEVDGKAWWNGPIYTGFILNGNYNAGGICWNPEAHWSDGFFDILVFEPRGFFTTLKNTLKIIRSSWKKVVGVHRIRGQRIEVFLEYPEVKPHPLFEIDGDLQEDITACGAVVELLPGAIQLQTLS